MLFSFYCIQILLPQIIFFVHSHSLKHVVLFRCHFEIPLIFWGFNKHFLMKRCTPSDRLLELITNVDAKNMYNLCCTEVSICVMDKILTKPFERTQGQTPNDITQYTILILKEF